jgi:hypothetical protein
VLPQLRAMANRVCRAAAAHSAARTRRRTWSSTNEIIASFSVIVCAASSSAFCTDAAAVHCAAHRPMPRPCAGDRVAAVVMRASLRWRYRCTRSLALPCVREHVRVSVCAFLLFVSVRA